MWNDKDEVVLRLPMKVVSKRWHENSVAFHRGPLLFALGLGEKWEDKREYLEVYPTSPWNFGLFEDRVLDPEESLVLEVDKKIALNPWTLATAPLRLKTQGVRIPDWKLYHNSAGPIPWSPQKRPKDAKEESLILVPFGSTTLRVSEFPTVN